MSANLRLMGTLFIGLVVGCAVMLAACGRKEEGSTVERIRAIKTFTVKESEAGRIRKFSGVVEAADKSSISFEVSGNVQEVRVNVGDKVKKGQVLAVLDTRTYKLNVEAAEADLGNANVRPLTRLRPAMTVPSKMWNSPPPSSIWPNAIWQRPFFGHPMTA